MQSTLQVPCVRCGRTVTVATLRPLPTCDRCTGAAVTWEVRAGAERVRLDLDGVRDRLRVGTLAGTDLVVEGAGVTPIAAHAAFRTFFLAGHLDLLPPPPPPAAPPRPPAAPMSPALRRVLVLLGLGGVLAVAGVAVAPMVPELLEGMPSLESLMAGPPAPVAAPIPPPPPVGAPLGELLTRVGVVDEPRATLLAAAWDARLLATPTGHAAAIVAAERAVGRTPDDPEALALLAELLADTGEAPALRAALLGRALGTAPTAPAVRRAHALDALARVDLATARKFVEECLRDTPADLGCREAQLHTLGAAAPVLKEAEAANLLYSLDQLAAAWPENRDLPRRAALLAARAEALGAEERLSAQRARFPDDDTLLAADALLAFRNGTFVAARRLVARLDPVPAPLLVEAAGDAVGRGAPAEALALLAKVKDAPPSRDARLYEAQARWLLARDGAGSPADAAAAGARAAEIAPGDPAVVHVRVAIALLAKNAADAAKAWETLETKGVPPVDLANAWLARAALDLALQHPREAMIEVESAIQADRSLPDVYLWQAATQVAGQNGPAAVAGLRGAIAAIDGRHARRRPYGGSLRIPADLAPIRAGLASLLGNDPTRTDDLALALATVGWLGGDLDAAAAIVPVAERGSDADALALAGRVLLARGEPEAALSRLDLAVALRPKEMAWQLVRAEALLALGRGKEAASALAAARSGVVPASSLQLLVARSAAKQGDAAAALVARRAAAAADPSDLVARRALRGVAEE